MVVDTHEITMAIDAMYPGEPMEDLKRLIGELTREIHEERGEFRATLAMIQKTQLENVRRLDRMEERESACQKAMERDVRSLHKRITEESVSSKRGEDEVRSRVDGLMKMVWGALLAALASVAGAFWGILGGK